MDIFEYFCWILGVLLALYLGIGAVLALYEKSQKDNPFKIRTMFLWAPIFLGWVRGY